MAEESTAKDIDLETFLKSAGQSFTDAQKALVPGIDVPVNMMLSSAELELKVAVTTDTTGRMMIRPISSEDLLRGGIDPGMISTIRTTFVSSIGEVESQLEHTPDISTTGGVKTVPVLTGLTLDEAAAFLISAGWQFEPYAAGREEIASSGMENRGRIIRQQPSAGEPADKTSTTIQLWADLGSNPVKEIDGVGVKYEESLAKTGITTVGELSLADSREVASTLRISESRAKSLIDMAGLMSRLAVLGFKDEVVELLVKGASIRSVEQLASANASEIYNVCQEAVSSGKVQTPQKFSFTTDHVKDWIKAAGSYLGK